jgi:hypothetical protein
MLSVPHSRPEARRNPGLTASCLTSIRYSVRHVRQGRYQRLSLFAAAFDLTWLTCLSSGNHHLPGTLRFPVQITRVTHLTEDGVDRQFIKTQVGHESDSSLAIYTHVSSDFMNSALRRALAPAFSDGTGNGTESASGKRKDRK